MAAQELTPEDVARDPYLRDTNPILDLLVKYFQQTEGVAKPGRRSSVSPTPQPTPDARSSVSKRMRETAGPIGARLPKKYASELERLMKEIP